MRRALSLPLCLGLAAACLAPLPSQAQDTPPAAADARPANPGKPSGGCLKYGAGGAVAGHVAGHHGVAGALAGCATGAYVKHKSKQRYQETGHY